LEACGRGAGVGGGEFGEAWMGEGEEGEDYEVDGDRG
jgi:hypothetical protein